MNITFLAPSRERVLADVAVRTVKTAVQTFLGIVGANVLGWTDLGSLRSAGVVALAAAATVIVNMLASWASSP